jgi:hypothetical protein
LGQLIPTQFWLVLQLTFKWELLDLIAAVQDIGREIFVFFIFRWVPCHHGMARPQVADGGDGLQIWRVLEEQTLNNAKSLINRAGTRRPTISKTEGQNLKPK